MNRTIVDAKPTGVTKTLTFDFSNELAAGETISTQAVTCTVYSGVDASPSSVINGAAALVGSTVTQSVKAGTAGVIYYLVCTVTTSTSQTLQRIAYLAVVPDVV